MLSVEYDLRFLEQGLSLLKDYLLAGDLYWPVGINPPVGNTPYPSLTLEALLLARKRLEAYRLSFENEARFVKALRQMDALCSRWKVAWERKALRSFRTRLRQWRDFLEEYRQDPGEHFDRYAYEVRHRVFLSLLETEAGSLPEEDINMMKMLDNLLRLVLEPAAFIWEPVLCVVFSDKHFWFLYGILPKERNIHNL